MNRKLILPMTLAVLMILTAQLLNSDPLQEQNNAVQSPVTASSSAAAPLPVADNSTYFEALLTKGLSTEEAQLLVLYKIQQQYVLHPPTTQYWRPFTAHNSPLDMAAQAHQVRSALLAVFGHGARDNVLFKQVFYPLAHEADYLSSTEQIAVFEQILKRQVTQAEMMRNGFNLKQRGDLLFSLGDPSDILPSDAAFEWKLRKSYLAQRLRNSGVSFDEQTFRDSYKLLAPIHDLNTSNILPNGSDLSIAFTGLDTLLGEDNANRVKAALDPLFAQFQYAAEQQGLNPNQIFGAYSIISEWQAQLMSAVDTMPSDEDSAMQLINQATETRDSRLASFIGREVAEQLIATYETEVPIFLGQEAAGQLIEGDTNRIPALPSMQYLN